MRKILRITWREYLAAVRTKGFIIGLVVAPVLMCGGLIAMKVFEGQVDTTDQRLAVVDRSGAVAQALLQAAETRSADEIHDKETGKKTQPAYLIEIAAPDKENPERQRLELSDRVRARKLHAFLEIGSDVLHPGSDPGASCIAYHAKNAALDDLRRWLSGPINNHLRRLRLSEAGVDESTVKDLFRWQPVEGLGLISVDEETGKIKEAQRSNEGAAVGVPMIMVMLMFMMVMMGAVPLLHSVMEERNQRIAEVMLGSVTPFEFMMGKVLGGIGVSLTGAAVYVIGGIVAVNRMGLGDYVPYRLLLWFFTYMLLNVTLLGSMFAAVGSACNDAKEAQSLTLPVMLPVMIPMFLLVPVIKQPLSAFATSLSLFPFFTPTLMLLRQSTPAGIPAWQPWVGLTGVLIVTVLTVWAGGRIFRVAILMQGKPPRLGDLCRWAIRG
ncbi:MAG TPA: ABC transporter permease [Sumerlaeia bacterium]|nr:ABC transporter permease [Sumerlaeia bacterium]